MKVFKIFVLLGFVAAFVSCSNDDDNTPSYEFSKAHLLGKYNLDAFQSEEVKNRTIDGFEVTTTTNSEASTINFTYEFSSDNQVILNGNFLMSETKKQGGQTSDSTYIINNDSLKLPYSVNESEKTITIDGLTYEVSKFSADGFKLNAHIQETIENGTREYTEEIVLSK